MTAGGLVTTLRHHDTCFAWLVVCYLGFSLEHWTTETAQRSRRLAILVSTYKRPTLKPASSGGVVARGDGRARTGDPLLAKQVLFQLSYIPEWIRAWAFVDSNHRPHGYQPCALTN